MKNTDPQLAAWRGISFFSAFYAMATHLCVMAIIVWGIGFVLAFPNVSVAVTEGRPCISEPTDDVISYGGLITCTIGFNGDVD